MIISLVEACAANTSRSLREDAGDGLGEPADDPAVGADGDAPVEEPAAGLAGKGTGGVGEAAGDSDGGGAACILNNSAAPALSKSRGKIKKRFMVGRFQGVDAESPFGPGSTR